jgi:hypothetical protein
MVTIGFGLALLWLYSKRNNSSGMKRGNRHLLVNISLEMFAYHTMDMTRAERFFPLKLGPLLFRARQTSQLSKCYSCASFFLLMKLKRRKESSRKR